VSDNQPVVASMNLTDAASVLRLAKLAPPVRGKKKIDLEIIDQAVAAWPAPDRWRARSLLHAAGMIYARNRFSRQSAFNYDE
jgi:hypothetical protein